MGLAKILVVDDEPDVLESLASVLEDHYEVLKALNLEQARQAISTVPDLLLLDINIKNENGVQFCQELRESEKTEKIPVLIMTGKDSRSVRIDAFGSGADDFITKPFHIDELRVRIAAKLKRFQNLIKSSVPSLILEKLAIDPRQIAGFIDGHKLDLSSIEIRILMRLMSKPREVIAREDLESHIWGQDRPTTRSLDTHINALRKKISGSGVRIRTVYGRGFVIESDPIS